MVSKCANPDCSTPFLYLRAGKLFRWENLPVVKLAVPNVALKKPNKKIEFFWLCDDCASKMTVVFREGVGITTKGLAQAKKAAS